MVLEVAVAGEAHAIITYNQRDFAGSESFGIRLMTPHAWLAEIAR